MRAKKPKTYVSAALKKLGVDPIAELVAVAREAADAEIADHRLLSVRTKVWAELLQYCNQKLRAIELTGGKGKPEQLKFDWGTLLRPSGGE